MNTRSFLRARYLLAFLCCSMLISELHEQAHIQTGRLLCGAYGPRDFLSWQTACGGARSVWASAAGPLFLYAVAWLGVWILYRARHASPRGNCSASPCCLPPCPSPASSRRR